MLTAEGLRQSAFQVGELEFNKALAALQAEHSEYYKIAKQEWDDSRTPEGAPDPGKQEASLIEERRVAHAMAQEPADTRPVFEARQNAYGRNHPLRTALRHRGG